MRENEERIEMPIGGYLRWLRESRGLSCRQLAERMGTYGTHVSARERGRVPITLGWMERVARGLDMTIRLHLTPIEHSSSPTAPEPQES